MMDNRNDNMLMYGAGVLAVGILGYYYLNKDKATGKASTPPLEASSSKDRAEKTR
jgi:hypothetical protein